LKNSEFNPRCGKVCVVAPAPPPYGGMSLQAETMVQRLRDEGVTADLLSTNPAPPRALETIQRVPGLRTLLREVQYLDSLIKKMRECRILHHFAASGLYFFAHSIPVLAMGRLLKKRVILNYRGGKADEFLSRWAWCVVPFMRMASQICVPSEFLQEVFSKYGMRAMLLPNVAATEIFPWKKRARFAPVLLVTRHLEPMYNTECLLRAFGIIQRRFPEAVLTIAGDGSEAARLKNLAAEWGLAGVKFCGAVPYRDLPSLYATHDIYINSSNVDNFPGALVEAACSGLPIVTTGAGGIPWMIRNHENGIIVGLNDHERLAEGAIAVIENAEFGRSLAQQAWRWAQQFSWANVFPKLMAAYGGHVDTAEPQIGEVRVVTQ
jgi:glycosyltransferase involved in cell wall biosynthesis